MSVENTEPGGGGEPGTHSIFVGQAYVLIGSTREKIPAARFVDRLTAHALMPATVHGCGPDCVAPDAPLGEAHDACAATRDEIADAAEAQYMAQTCIR